MKKILLTLLAIVLIAVNASAQQYIDERIIPPSITRDAEIIPTGETNAVCISNTGTPAPSITLCSTLALTGKTVLFKLPEYTVATLPASHALSIVTDGATSVDCTAGGGSTRVLCHWNGSVWAAIGGGVGVGDPGSNGIAVRSALNTLIARTLTGTSGRIVVTNGTGVAGNPTLDTGSDIPAKNTANTFSAANGFTSNLVIPLKTTPGDLSLLTNGEVYIDGELVKYKSNTGTVYTLFKVGDPIVRVSTHTVAPTLGSDDVAGYLVGDVWINTTTGKHCVAISVATGSAVWDCSSISGAGSLQAAKDGGAIIANAVDGPTAVLIGNGTLFHCFWVDSSNAAQTGICDSSGALVAVDKITKADANKVVEIQDSSGTTVFKVTDTSGVGAISTAKGLTSGFSIPYTGTGASGAIQDGDDFPKIVRVPYGQTITKICGTTDTGTTTFNIQRNDGSPANISSSDIVAATSEACSTTFTNGENILTTGQYLDLVIVTGATSGTPTKLTIGFETSRN